MKVMLAEYATCTGLEGALRAEGFAMLSTLKQSFEQAGCRVFVPRDFGKDFATTAKISDCGLVIAPDDRLAADTAVLESGCINLGSPPAAIRLCADKLETTELLLHNGLYAPRIVREGGAGDGATKCVVKPRTGCGSESVFVAPAPVEREGYISTEYIEGEHLSVSFVSGSGFALPLTLNRQHIHMDGGVAYDGNDVNVEHPAGEEIVAAARRAGQMLGCRGLFGVDIVYGRVHDGADIANGRVHDGADIANGRVHDGADIAGSDRHPYVVDVNPRPTTSVVGVARVIDRNLADLVLLARFGELPDRVGYRGRCSFTKTDLEAFARR